MKNLSCAVAFLLSSVLGSTHASQTVMVEIDCKHPDTDHETTDEDSVYAEFYGTESDDRIVGRNSQLQESRWVVKGTSNCDGYAKVWGAETDLASEMCIPAYVKILNKSDNAFFIDRLRITKNKNCGIIFERGANKGGGWCVSNDNSDSFSSIDGEEVDCYQAIIYRLDLSDRDVCTGEDVAFDSGVSQTYARMFCTSRDCVPGDFNWDSEEEEVISAE